MTRISIQLLKILLWVIISGIILLIVLSLLFGENIQKSLLNNINENLHSEIHVENMDISLIENFPSATLKLMEVYIQEAEGFQMDTLIYAKEIYTEVRLLDIIRKKFEVQRIVILNGLIKLKYNDLKNKNFNIFKKKEGGNKLNVRKVILLNSNVSYTNNINNTIIELFPEKLLLRIQQDNYTNLEIDGKLLSEQLTIYNKNYADKKKIHLTGEISFKKDSLFIRKSELNIEDVIMSITGGIYHKNITDLYIGCQNQSFKSIMENTPNHLIHIYNVFTADGLFSCEGNITGLITRRINPAFKMNWQLREGSFDLKNNPFTLRNIYMNGKINNGDSKNFEDTEIEATEFNAKTGNGTIKGFFNIRNLNSYFLQTELESIWDLAEINYFSENSPFFNLNGKLQANTYYNGRLSFNNNFKTHFRNSKHKTKATLTNVTFMYKNSSLPFTLDNVKCEIDDNKIIISESKCTIADSDLEFDGKVTDFIGYILKQDSSFEIAGNLKSVYIKFDEILTINKNDKKK